MNIEQHSGFFVAGIATRTNNSKEMIGKGETADAQIEVFAGLLSPHAPALPV